jgi:uncharacterized membrane protein YtjA (UPF0391 family)
MLTWSVIYFIIAAVSAFYGMTEINLKRYILARGVFFFFGTLFLLTIIYSFLPEPRMA